MRAQAKTVDEEIDPLVGLLGGKMKQSGVELEIFGNRQFIVERKRLGHEPDALARLLIARVDRIAEQKGLAFRGWQQTGQHLHGRGLAATIGAEKPEDFAFLDAETHLVDRSEAVEQPCQAPGDNGRLSFRLLQRRNNEVASAAASTLRCRDISVASAALRTALATSRWLIRVS